jgi:Zn finger protein HypA/HybF involved in hydrogenase expression
MEENMNHTHFRCKKCRVILPLESRENKPWTGWKAGGELVKVDNFCCPECGSNDLVLRAPGVDAKAA